MVVERKFIAAKTKEMLVKEYLGNRLKDVGFSHIDIRKTPVGYNIVIYSSRPGLIVGRRGINLREVQKELEKKFGLESPIIDVREVENPNLDPNVIIQRIGSQLSRFGVARFKAIGHREIDKVMKAGAIGVEIEISGKIPSDRANSWKFYAGYLPKCGDVAVSMVRKAKGTVLLKPGIIGISVKILPPGVKMPDQIYIKESSNEEIKQESEEENGNTAHQGDKESKE